MEFNDISPQLEKLSGQFQYREPPDALIKLQEFVTYLLRAIADFLRNLHINIGMGDTSSIGNAMQFLIMALGVVCLAIVLVIAWSRMKQLKEQARLATRGALALEERLDAAGWRVKAEELARKEQYKEACRALYLSVLYLMDESKVLEFGPTRTNYEYYYALSGKSSLQRGFRQLADLVEVMWFGNHQARLDDFQSCTALLSALEKEVQASSSADAAKPQIEGRG